MKNKNEFLQILRSVLFLMIFSYHCEIPGTSFFWAGVEIFFCISGFFIFNKIFQDIKSIDCLYKMVWNRIKRLWFPNYTIIVTVCLLIFIIYGKFDFLRFISFLLFSQNIVWLFLGLNEYSIMAHMWTISIEVQTILVIGVLSVILYKFRISQKVIIPLMLIISLVYILTFPYFLNSKLAFSLSPLSHFFAFALGGLVLLLSKRKIDLSKLGSLFLLIGSLGIGGITLFISKICSIGMIEAFLSMNSASVNILLGRPVAMIYVFISFIGAGLLTLCINYTHNISGKIINNLIMIGNNSFVLYLLHYPIITFLSNIFINKLVVFVLSLIFTIAFAKLLNVLKISKRVTSRN